MYKCVYIYMSSLKDPMSNKTLIVPFDLWFRYKSPMDGSAVSLEDSEKYIGEMIRLKLANTPPKFNSSPLKNGGWKTSLSYWVSVTFQGRTVKLRGG